VRIGIDYTAAVRQHAGIGRYTRQLVRALAALDRDNQYVVFVAGGWGAGDGLGPWPGNFHLRTLPLPDRWLNILWQRWRLPLPIQWVTGPLDLFHSPDFVLPPLGRTPAVLTVHDLSFMRVPDCFVPGFREYLEGAVSRAVRLARLILADSCSTRHDLIELMQVEPERVVVLYPGVDERFRPVADPAILDPIRDAYRLPQSFLLGLGTLQPRKNFEGLVEAFSRLLAVRGHEPLFADLHLVIGGGSGWMHEEIVNCVKRSGLGQRVRLLGFVDDGDLPGLYSMASAFAFPSFYEGFGVPVLEAMACGTPVVAADNSSLPEAIGDAGLLVPTGDPDALAAALGCLMTDDVLRARLISAGQGRAQGFTWTASARSLLAAYSQFRIVNTPRISPPNTRSYKEP
jgi:glycosyltransferase involved in cell wall biosynthesis